MYKQSQVNVRFRDFAGHDHYSASHDFFAVAMTAPSVATIVVDGTESVEEITKRVSATAASFACRQSTSDDGEWITMYYSRVQRNPICKPKVAASFRFNHIMYLTRILSQ